MVSLRVALCQLDLTVGDLDGNVARLLAALGEAEDADADVAVFPELAITAYPPEDLLLKSRFVADSQRALEKVAARTDRCAAVVGCIEGGDGGPLYNAAAVCARGQVVGTYEKRHLPNYHVFDEVRYFRPGDAPLELFEIAGALVGVSICEDVWVPDGPVVDVSRGGAQLVLNINASPYHAGKVNDRHREVRRRIAEGAGPVVYVNLVGGQDELLFDGGSFVMDERGEVVAQAPQFAEAVLVVDVEVGARGPSSAYPVSDVTPASTAARSPLAPTKAELVDPPAEVYDALVLGTRDYVHKNGFTDVGIALSGGIDSSLVAAVAVDALGPDHVHGVLMPSRYSSDHSLTDAAELATNLGIEHRTIPIEPAHQAYLEMLAESFAGLAPDLTEENLQSRIRGMLMMALANKFGWLVLTTGNKSESAVGYSTLYGDTAGAFAVIKDLWKLSVYELARDRNRRAGRPLIPEHVLDKPPSAELRPDQRDDQSLPPYEVLDPILVAYVECDLTAAELVAAGHDPDVVHAVTRLVDIAEYKRRQNPPGVRVSPKAFGKDRRVPITNRYRGDQSA